MAELDVVTGATGLSDRVPLPEPLADFVAVWTGTSVGLELAAALALSVRPVRVLVRGASTVWDALLPADTLGVAVAELDVVTGATGLSDRVPLQDAVEDVVSDRVRTLTLVV